MRSLGLREKFSNSEQQGKEKSIFRIFRNMLTFTHQTNKNKTELQISPAMVVNTANIKFFFFGNFLYYLPDVCLQAETVTQTCTQLQIQIQIYLQLHSLKLHLLTEAGRAGERASCCFYILIEMQSK